MDKKIIFRIIIYNLILSSLISIDLLFPTKEDSVTELSSVYGFENKTGSSRRPAFDNKIILELTNGERYRLGKLPEKEFENGTEIILIKSILSKNVNEIKVFDKGWKKFEVGLFSNLPISLLFIGIVLISLLNLFYSNKILNLLLIASMMSITILTFIYFVFF